MDLDMLFFFIINYIFSHLDKTVSKDIASEYRNSLWNAN